MDFSPLKRQMDHMALLIAIFILVVLILGYLLVFILKLLKIPRFLAQPIAGLGTLYIAYRIFIIMFK